MKKPFDPSSSLFLQLLLGSVLALVALSFLAPLLGIQDKDVIKAVALVMGVVWVVFTLPDITKE